MTIKFLRDATPLEAENHAEFKAGRVLKDLPLASEDRWIRRGAAERIGAKKTSKKVAKKTHQKKT